MMMAFYHLLLSSLCLISLAESINNGGITIDLIHRDSPLSPSYDPSQTRFERLKGSFDRSFSRKSSLSLKSSSKFTESLDTPITSDGGEYLMKVQLGTPPVEVLGIADTGSDLAWTQCKPCTQCYKQSSPIFDPSKTSSYRTVSCQSDECSATGSPSCDSKNVCQYLVSYGDQSYSRGDLAVETLSFGSDVSFPKVVFGCGHENDGTFSVSGAASGIIGLGGGSISIINQLQSSIGGRFSYCLTPFGANVSSKISFGSNAIVTGPNVLSTPIVKKSPDTFYYLTLEGLSVGTEKLLYKPSNTKALSEEGNIIIDSGTTLTFVPQEFYDGLEASMKGAIKGTPASDSQGTFKLCYQKPSGGVFSSPPVTAHFSGSADLVLPQESIFVEVEDGILCLTLLPSDDLAIFGNLHQVNFHIGYDLVNQKVNFLQTDCTKS